MPGHVLALWLLIALAPTQGTDAKAVCPEPRKRAPNEVFWRTGINEGDEAIYTCKYNGTSYNRSSVEARKATLRCNSQSTWVGDATHQCKYANLAIGAPVYVSSGEESKRNIYFADNALYRGMPEQEPWMVVDLQHVYVLMIVTVGYQTWEKAAEISPGMSVAGLKEYTPGSKPGIGELCELETREYMPHQSEYYCNAGDVMLAQYAVIRRANTGMQQELKFDEVDIVGRGLTTDINLCIYNPCVSGSTCQSLLGDVPCRCTAKDIEVRKTCSQDMYLTQCHMQELRNYQCTCRPGMTGTRCESDIDECASYPCGSNSIECKDSVNGYSCVCKSGYTGASCNIDINECESNPCLNGGKCTNGMASYSCTCAAGYKGVTCAMETACNSRPCANGGTCVENGDMYTCTCVAGYAGPTCTVDNNKCDNTKCQNGAVCYDDNNLLDGFGCRCVGGYSGLRCQEEIDECASSPCKNGGACTDAINSYSCKCASGFMGEDCSNSVREASGVDVVVDPEGAVQEGKALILHALATGGVPDSYTYTWTFISKLTKLERKIPGQDVVISNASYNDAGTYVCYAQNDGGVAASTNKEVQVRYIPVPINPPVQVEGEVNKPVELSVEFYAYPEPTSVTWVYDQEVDDKKMSEGTWTKIGPDKYTTHHEVTPSQTHGFGNYRVILTSPTGFKEVVMELRLDKKLDESWTILYTKPTAYSMHVGWVHDSNTSPKYTVAYRVAGQTKWEVFREEIPNPGPGKKVDVVIDRLKPASTYQVQAEDKSTKSVALKCRTRNLPPPPEEIEFTEEEGQVRLTWDDLGNDYDRAVVEYCTPDYECKTKDVPAGTTSVLVDPESSYEYTYRVLLYQEDVLVTESKTFAYKPVGSGIAVGKSVFGATVSASVIGISLISLLVLLALIAIIAFLAMRHKKKKEDNVLLVNEEQPPAVDDDDNDETSMETSMEPTPVASPTVVTSPTTVASPSPAASVHKHCSTCGISIASSDEVSASASQSGMEGDVSVV